MYDTYVRLAVKVDVAYGSPTGLVRDLLAASMADFQEIDQSREPLVLFKDFGDSAWLRTLILDAPERDP